LTAKIFNEKRCERDNERLTESSIEESKRKYDASRVSNIDINVYWSVEQFLGLYV